MNRFPVSLFTGPKCAPCDAARQMLKDRGEKFKAEDSTEIASKIKEKYGYVCKDVLKEFQKYDDKVQDESGQLTQSKKFRNFIHKTINGNMVNIDVGDSAKNARVERDLDVAVNSIPLAMFYSSDGKPICDTQRGELKPSRHYTSREILGFLREVVDYRRAVSPDQRQ